MDGASAILRNIWFRVDSAEFYAELNQSKSPGNRLETKVGEKLELVSPSHQPLVSANPFIALVSNYPKILKSMFGSPLEVHLNSPELYHYETNI